MNLAVRDIRYHVGRFVLTGLGLSLLLATVMGMSGIYRGLVEDAMSLLDAVGADLWIVQQDTLGPFAETSRIPEDVYRVVRAVPGVREASPISFQTLQLRAGGRAVRVQFVGHRPRSLGAARAVVAGRPLLRDRGDMLIDRKAGIPLGSRLRVGRTTFTVVGLTDGIVSTSGDPAAFVSLEDAQEIQFLKPNEAVRNERARLEAELREAPALADVPAAALAPIVENVHLANAVLARLEPGADAREVAARIERWNHYRAMTAAEQEEVLVRGVVDRARQQLLLFRVILIVVVTVILALIVYTMTMEKTRDIATLKVIGAPDWKIASLVLQESLALGLTAFVLGTVLITLGAAYFPRRVAIIAVDQAMLLGIVVVICALAGLVGIRRALAVDPTTALAGG
jgi:putative ABC transport system permease protein